MYGVTFNMNISYVQRSDINYYTEYRLSYQNAMKNIESVQMLTCSYTNAKDLSIISTLVAAALSSLYTAHTLASCLAIYHSYNASFH